MALIFMFSSQNADISGNLSEGVTYRIASVIVNDFKELSLERQTEIVYRMHHYVRKAAHFSEYALLGVLAYLYSSQFFRKTKVRFLTTLPFCLIYASTDEFHQLFSKGRSGSPVDVMIDFSGSVTGAFFVFLLILCFRKIREKFSPEAREI